MVQAGAGAPIAAARAVTVVMRAAGGSVRGTRMVIPSSATAMVRPVSAGLLDEGGRGQQRVRLGGQRAGGRAGAPGGRS